MATYIWYVYLHNHQHSSQDRLHVESSEYPVLLTEAALNPTQNRVKTCQYLMETFSVPALCMQIQSVLALFASNKTTGIVIDIGDGVTHSVPVYCGSAISHATFRLDLAGRGMLLSLIVPLIAKI